MYTKAQPPALSLFFSTKLRYRLGNVVLLFLLILVIDKELCPVFYGLIRPTLLAQTSTPNGPAVLYHVVVSFEQTEDLQTV